MREERRGERKHCDEVARLRMQGDEKKERRKKKASERRGSNSYTYKSKVNCTVDSDT